MVTKTYYAITIGPIYKTLAYAQRTRELWAASYLFSYLMKRLLIKLIDIDAHIHMPYAGDAVKLASGPKKLFDTKELYEAGLFPDRCIFSLKTAKEISDVQDYIESVCSNLFKDFLRHLKSQNMLEDDEDTAFSFFEEYFQVYLIQKSYQDTKAFNEILSDLFAHLDVLELQQQYIPEERHNYVHDFLTVASLKGREHSVLVKDAKVLNKKDRFKFQSVIEIAAIGLLNRYDLQDKVQASFKDSSAELDDDASLVNTIKAEVRDDFRTYHKYYCIVHVDGDNFGAIIKALNDELFEEFSKSLTRFSLNVNEAISTYGGMSVYIGGDDALFFAPLRTNEAHIFDLIDKIDNLFKAEFNDLLAKIGTLTKQPALSVGIAVSYYKHPLAEALEKSRELLFSTAKKFKLNDNVVKNAVSFHVLKHSGQEFGGTLYKGNKKGEPGIYEIFKEMVQLSAADDVFISSIIQKINSLDVLISEIATQDERLEAFVQQFLDDAIGGNQDFKQLLKQLIKKVYTQTDSNKNKQALLYGVLRMTKFLNREDNE